MSLRRVLSMKDLKPMWEETVMVRQQATSRVLCCYKLTSQEVDDDAKAHLKTKLDLLMTVRHQGMRFIYEPTNPPYLFYAYCGGGSLQDAFKAHIFHDTKLSRGEILDILCQLTELCQFLQASDVGILSQAPLHIDPRCIFFDDHGILRMEIGGLGFNMVYLKQKSDGSSAVEEIVTMHSFPLAHSAVTNINQNQHLFYDVSGGLDLEQTLTGGLFNRRDNFSDIDSERSVSTTTTDTEPISTLPSTLPFTHPKYAPHSQHEVSSDICHHDRYIPPEYYTQGRSGEEGLVWSIGRLVYDACQLTLGLTHTKLVPVNKHYYKEGLDAEYGADLAILLRSMMQTNYKKRPSLAYILNLPVIKLAKRDFEERHGITRDNEGNTQLMLAAKQGDVSDVLRYLYQKCCRNNCGETALILALKYGHEDVGLILMDEECGYVDAAGNFAAKYALCRGAGEAFKRLSTTEKHLLIKFGITHLMIAAASGDSAGVAAYLDGNVKLALNGPGTTALMMASAVGSLECVEKLAPYEARIQDTDGLTAMMHATLHAQTDIVRFLSQDEANYLDNHGHSALIHAVYNYERAQEQMRKESASLRAGSIGPWSIRCGQLLAIIAHLAPLEMQHRTANGYTALMLAAQYGNIRAVEALARYEAGLQASDGTTALMLAIHYGHTSIAKCLIPYETGLRTNSRHSCGSGYTALMEAAVQADLEIINILGPKEINLLQPATKDFPSGKTATDWGTESSIVQDPRAKQDALFALLIYQERMKLADSSVQTAFKSFLMILSPLLVLLFIVLRKYA